ncbi:MAG: threonine--tRNA ligase, partial [Ileibacterium sp.]|nr:threonine--tRNA ligase [Ileibacterium sp.]
AEALEAKGLRVHVDDRNEKLGYRVREAQVSKIPYQLVVGDRDVENGTVTIRKSGSKDSTTVPLQEAVDRFEKEVAEKWLFDQQ